MHFRNIFVGCVLTAHSLAALAATGPTTPINYPVGTLFNAGLAFSKADGIKRLPSEAQAYCAASSFGGQTGWTLPSRLQLSQLYFDKGNSFLADNSWALDLFNTSSQTADGSYALVSLLNGATATADAPALTTCVNYTTVSNFVSVNNLTFQQPDATVRNFPAAEAYCAASTAGGLQGWRIPTSNELASVFFEKGTLNTGVSGWPTGWIWSANAAPGGREVVRMSDGARSYDRWSGVYNVTCVRDKEAIAVPTLISGGLRWTKPDTTMRQWNAAANFCTSTIAGLTGWRLPTQQELSDLYYDKGWFNLANAGWTSGWVWASTPVYNGHSVIQMLDGKPSYSVADAYATTCVRPVQVETFSTVSDAGLIWSKPSPRQLPIENAQKFCEANGLGNSYQWRAPNSAEIQTLYANRGAAYLSAAGFPSSGTGLWAQEDFAYESTELEGNGERRFLSCVQNQAQANTGKITHNGNVWDKPSANVRPWVMADLACVDKVIGGQTGWRLPRRTELQTLYGSTTPAAFYQAGWTLDWIWAYNPNSSGYQVVRMSDGAASWASTAVTPGYATTCMRDANGYPAGTILSNGLAFSRPAPITRPTANMLNYCANTTIGGLKGWRLPTLTELKTMITTQTSAKVLDEAWPADYVWTSTPYQSGYQVVRTSDGVVSWASGLDSNRSYVSCVR